MNQLHRHIERLLLQHNCVIVPNLGGFVAQGVPARYDAEEQLFLPPGRSVAFNTLLVINDGLLVQSYMQVEGCLFDEASRIIDEEVSQLRCQLEEKGSFELQGVGVLTSKEGEGINFTPQAQGISSPALFGMEALELFASDKSDARLAKTKRSTFSIEFPASQRQSKSRHLWLKGVSSLAAVAAILLCLVWATPSLPTTSRSHVNTAESFKAFGQFIKTQSARVGEQLSQFIASLSSPSENGTTALPANTNKRPSAKLDRPNRSGQTTTLRAATPAPLTAKETVKSDSTAVTPAPTVTTASAPVAKQAAQQQKAYTIVLASQVSQEGATTLVLKLRSEGFSQAAVLNGTRLRRVVYGQYESEEVARVALRALRPQNEAFVQAWILQQ